MAKIKRPDWLQVCQPQVFIDMYLSGNVSEAKGKQYIVFGAKHTLRAIYGSDLRAVFALLWQATFVQLYVNAKEWWEDAKEGQEET